MPTYFYLTTSLREKKKEKNVFPSIFLQFFHSYFSFCVLQTKQENILPYDYLITTNCCLYCLTLSYLSSSPDHSTMNTLLLFLIFSSLREMRLWLLLSSFPSPNQRRRASEGVDEVFWMTITTHIHKRANAKHFQMFNSESWALILTAHINFFFNSYHLSTFVWACDREYWLIAVLGACPHLKNNIISKLSKCNLLWSCSFSHRLRFTCSGGGWHSMWPMCM